METDTTDELQRRRDDFFTEYTKNDLPFPAKVLAEKIRKVYGIETPRMLLYRIGCHFAGHVAFHRRGLLGIHEHETEPSCPTAAS